METNIGVHTRCYLGVESGTSFLVIYGRIGRVRGTSDDLEYLLNQEVVSSLKIKNLVGTFSVGSVHDDSKSGEVYIPHDYIAFGNNRQTRHRATGFKNVDMFSPFCVDLRNKLLQAASTSNYKIHPKGVYACFHGFPRIETKAELQMYQTAGCDIVGQTLDPEATLAREAGVHYAAIVATIDDYAVRAKFLANDPTARETIDTNILRGREKTFEVFLQYIRNLKNEQITSICNCQKQKGFIERRKNLFYYRPRAENHDDFNI